MKEQKDEEEEIAEDPRDNIVPTRGLAAEQHDYGVNKRRAMYDFVAEQFGLRTEGLRNADGTYREETATVEHAPEMYVFGPEERLPEHAVKGSDALRKLLQEYRIEQ